MDYEYLIVVLLIGLVVGFSLRFEKTYGNFFQESAHNPIVRLMAGIVIVSLASFNTLFAILALIVVFFWVADVNLLSSIHLKN
jgi:hypothetical protein